MDGEGAGDHEALTCWLSSHCSCLLIYYGQQDTKRLNGIQQAVFS